MRNERWLYLLWIVKLQFLAGKHLQEEETKSAWWMVSWGTLIMMCGFKKSIGACDWPSNPLHNSCGEPDWNASVCSHLTLLEKISLEPNIVEKVVWKVCTCEKHEKHFFINILYLIYWVYAGCMIGCPYHSRFFFWFQVIKSCHRQVWFP